MPVLSKPNSGAHQSKRARFKTWAGVFSGGVPGHYAPFSQLHVGRCFLGSLCPTLRALRPYVNTRPQGRFGEVSGRVIFRPSAPGTAGLRIVSLGLTNMGKDSALTGAAACTSVTGTVFKAAGQVWGELRRPKHGQLGSGTEHVGPLGQPCCLQLSSRNRRGSTYLGPALLLMPDVTFLALLNCT